MMPDIAVRRLALLLAIPLLVLPLLVGCTSWRRMTSFVEDAPPPVTRPVPVAATPVAAPAPLQAAQPANDFCQAVARQDATRNGFDAATQARVLSSSYQQCVGIYGTR